MPLPSTTDDVLVKAPDGSWKVFRAGKLVDLPKPELKPTAPLAAAPPPVIPAVVVSLPTTPPPTTQTLVDLPAPSLSPAASVFVSLPQAAAPAVPLPPPVVATPPVVPVKPTVRPSPLPSPASSNRPRIIDIQPPQQLVGPVEELKMSIADFRGLSDSVEVRLKRIQEKFALLEQESYAKKMEAIGSWRASEVYALYVALGQESIGKGQTIQQAIDARRAVNQPTLSFEEFQAVTSLNRELRF